MAYKSFQVASISLNTTPLDLEGNLSLHKQVLKDSQVQNSSIVLFPELSLTGYGCEDAFYRPYLWERAWSSLLELLNLVGNQLVAVGLPYYFQSSLYNAVAILHQKKIIGIVPKKNLANSGIHYESRWFTAWKKGTIEVSEYFFGEGIFNWDGLRIALEICEDSWVAHKPSYDSAQFGVDIILSPGASHFAFGKFPMRSRIFLESSRTIEACYVFSNLMGNESGRVIFDGGNLIVSNGQLYALGPRLSLGDYHITTSCLNLETMRSQRVKFFRKNPNYKLSKQIPTFLIPGSPFHNQPPDLPVSQRKSQELFEENTFQEFTSVQILGLFDYLRKSGLKGYTLSLSGGADSSSLAILVITMQKEVEKHFGKDYWKNNGYTLPILHSIYQKTRNNSESTLQIARNLSKELGCNYHEIEIDSEVDSMVEKISQVLNIPLNWKDHGIALQNIQARVRSPLVWLLANVNHHLLLSTGNRSEASVGYTTMDGDSSGSLAPLTGVSKTFILQWLEYISQGKDPRIPKIKILDELLKAKPTAELKPLEEKQEDEKDLMPYPILQKIEYYCIYQGLKPEIALGLLQSEFPEFQIESLSAMVKKFLQLFAKSQWKRERLPPSFHLDEYGLDPKSSYRYPILSCEFPLPNTETN